MPLCLNLKGSKHKNKQGNHKMYTSFQKLAEIQAIKLSRIYEDCDTNLESLSTLLLSKDMLNNSHIPLLKKLGSSVKNYVKLLNNLDKIDEKDLETYFHMNYLSQLKHSDEKLQNAKQILSDFGAELVTYRKNLS